MRKIIIDIKDFFKENFNVYAYLFTVLFLASALYLNYKFNFEKSFINGFYGKPVSFAVYFLYYSLPYLLTLIVILYIKQKQYLIKNREFWVKFFVFFGIFSFTSAFWGYRYIMDFSDLSYSDKRYFYKLYSNLKRIIPFILVFYAVKRHYDKDMPDLYGLRLKGVNLKPFIVMLLLMIPLIVIASFQPAFKISYPQYKFYYYDGASGMSPLSSELLFELAYGLDFAAVELMYRGALIIGMINVLGKETVLPATASYVVLHFGKPAGEAISSFFGGLFLGIYASAERNITGGIFIHTGIAYLMEIAAILQHYYGN
ncbi:MAG: hypothetical protein GXO50_03255 [Chlorobi bacterium]|nr:hypothetical protein [Chlorobiota bacterium]